MLTKKGSKGTRDLGLRISDADCAIMFAASLSFIPQRTGFSYFKSYLFPQL